MKRKEQILLGTACFFAGVVAGFFIAPIKKGMYCCNNTTNYLKDPEELKEVNDIVEEGEE
ncbi:MAG: hypothetical protein E7214_12780 [Clostridium sp.]|nr:hypothetical protein [Clostridium sp.]